MSGSFHGYQDLIIFRIRGISNFRTITMSKPLCSLLIVITFLNLAFLGCATTNSPEQPMAPDFILDFDTSTDPGLQAALEIIHHELLDTYEMTPDQGAVGVLDLSNHRLGMIQPDRMEYAASVAKIGILLAYFQLHANDPDSLDPEVRQDLGLMIKNSSNEAATLFSRELGLQEIQKVLNSYGFYDENHGGGIWVGKHYGAGDERIGDPIADYSHTATVRQLLRFYLLLEQGKLVSPEASRAMLDIFLSPDLPHDHIKFVRALDGRNVKISRKWGSWRNWLHDTAMISGPNRKYILVALTDHPNGDSYLEDLARAIDDLMK